MPLVINSLYAAPPEFSNFVGTPLIEGLHFVESLLVGAGLRNRIRLIASGKILSAFSVVKTLAIGADVCNSARAFMFALGCIQALKCNTNKCPTGVATQVSVDSVRYCLFIAILPHFLQGRTTDEGPRDRREGAACVPLPPADDAGRHGARWLHWTR